MKYKVAQVNSEYPQCGMYMNDTLEKKCFLPKTKYNNIIFILSS